MTANSDPTKDPDLRLNVGIMLINSANQVLAGEATHYPGEWMMPQGGIDKGETPFEAMQRELVEETSIEFEETCFLREHDKWLSYLFREPLVKEGRVYSGQCQKWFLLEYQGPLPEASLTLDHEFLRFAWVDPSWLVENTTKFKVKLYQDIFSAFEIEIL